MHESLWALSASDLLSRTAGSDPTPGGGSVAAVSGAFGIALLQMAVAVTDDASLHEHAARLSELRAPVVAAADVDVEAFEGLVTALRLPRGSEDRERHRRAAVEVATIAAAEAPLALVAALIEALVLSHELEPLVKPSIVSDVLAGRDLIAGAARAGIRTVDTNLHQLGRLSSGRLLGLRDQRDHLARQLEAAA